MADWIQWLVLGLVQGLTEFLPISSSAHLILASHFAGWEYQGVVMDIAAHFGSLLAVMFYYRKDLMAVLSGRDWPLFQQLAIATIPLALAGLLLADVVETQLRAIWIIALASAVFGVLLWWSQKHSQNESMSLKKALALGLAQCLALIPGASRSGVTMTAGMLLGLSKSEAARMAFLMAIPALLMTTAYGGLKLWQAPAAYNLTAVGSVVLVSFLAAWLCIHWLLKFIERIDFAWFMHYRLVLSALILWTLL